MPLACAKHAHPSSRPTSLSHRFERRFVGDMAPLSSPAGGWWQDSEGSYPNCRSHIKRAQAYAHFRSLGPMGHRGWMSSRGAGSPNAQDYGRSANRREGQAV